MPQRDNRPVCRTELIVRALIVTVRQKPETGPPRAGRCSTHLIATNAELMNASEIRWVRYEVERLTRCKVVSGVNTRCEEIVCVGSTRERERDRRGSVVSVVVV